MTHDIVRNKFDVCLKLFHIITETERKIIWMIIIIIDQIMMDGGNMNVIVDDQ